ncbi:MAG: hypothetical protein AAGI01_12010 [Myxococcota bacterium]
MGSERMRAEPLCDDVTRRVLGVPVLRARFAPDSHDAQEQSRALFTESLPRDRTSFDALRQRHVVLEAWWDGLEDPGRRGVRAALAGLPPMHRVRAIMEQAAGASVACEQELFVLKRWALGARAVLARATGAVVSEREARAALLESVLELLHPEEPYAAHFHLSSALDASLAAAREDTRRKRTRVRELEGAVHASIAEDHLGMRLRLDGAMTMPSRSSMAAREAAARDDRMVQRAGVWHMTDDVVRAAREELDVAMAEEERCSGVVCAALTERVRALWVELSALADAVVCLDVGLAKVRLKQDIGGCWPEWRGEDGIELEHGVGVHLLEDAQRVSVRVHAPLVVITGPNMGGKSSLLGLVGLCQWCMQHGMPAPAKVYRAPWCAQIVYVGSDGDPRTPGLSSFGREVRRIVDALETPRPRMWLFDELGRGTHPEEGARLASKILRALIDRGDRALAATHFPEVARLEEAQKLRVRGLDDLSEGASGAVYEADSAQALAQALRAVMDYQPVEVNAHDPPRDAERVARWLGLGVLIAPVDPPGD